MRPAAQRLSADDPARLRLRTLVVLRWTAIFSQAAVVLAVHLVYGFELPFGFCMTAIAVSAWLNTLVSIRHPLSRLLPEREAVAYLAFDTAQLTAILYLTGGLENPFAILFVGPITISAMTLSIGASVVVGGLICACLSLLAVFHLPLPSRPGFALQLPGLYVAGVWVSLTAGVVFMGVYVGRIMVETSRMTRAFAATQLALAREQRLAALGGLAAAAAHELGTPLGTIALTAKELELELAETKLAPAHKDDIALIRAQAERCRAILRELAQAPEGAEADSGGAFAEARIGAILEEAAAPYRGFGKAIEIETEEGPAPRLARTPELLHGLGNLIENAAEFAAHRVVARARWDGGRIEVEIADDGPGFRPDMLDKLGEPYVSDRSRRRAQGPRGGLGLGVFIAKTLLERTGAEISFANARSGGAVARIVWPASTGPESFSTRV